MPVPGMGMEKREQLRIRPGRNRESLREFASVQHRGRQELVLNLLRHLARPALHRHRALLPAAKIAGQINPVPLPRSLHHPGGPFARSQLRIPAIEDELKLRGIKIRRGFQVTELTVRNRRVHFRAAMPFIAHDPVPALVGGFEIQGAKGLGPGGLPSEFRTDAAHRTVGGSGKIFHQLQMLRFRKKRIQEQPGVRAHIHAELQRPVQRKHHRPTRTPHLAGRELTVSLAQPVFQRGRDVAAPKTQGVRFEFPKLLHIFRQHRKRLHIRLPDQHPVHPQGPR